MNAERWQRIAHIFEKAHVLSAGERARLIEEECRSDPSLRDEVVSLLSADQASSNFLSRPAHEHLARQFAADGWNLRAGERVGSYEVIELLGAGGGGEVWRARDQRLGRDVAIKVLLRHWAVDDARVRRFAEEARAAGALNHPNVLTVFDVGEIRGIPYLVCEYLEGRSLRERLEAGPLPPLLAARTAREVALGLSAAHARGIIHRDLKPENVFVREDGGVKILDFGLAKLDRPEAGSASCDDSRAAIFGTAAYMAPEQIQGLSTDARTDLFALGVVLYEMLSGRHPFRGASTLETLQAILAAEPPSLVAAGAAIPARLAQIVERLLQKNPQLRFQSAADVAWILETYARADDPPTMPAPRRSGNWKFWAAGASAVIAAGTFAIWQPFRQDAPIAASPPPTTQFTWTLPDDLVLDSAPVVAPNGRHIAFVGRNDAGTQLYVHDLDSLGAEVVPSSAGARQPFWSPDSRHIGFFSSRKLKRVQWPGGAPVEVASVGESRGGAWGATGSLVIAPDLFAALDQVHKDGGPVSAAALLDISKSDNAFLWPVILPDSTHFLYVVRAYDDERRGIYAARLGAPASRPTSPLLRTESSAAVAPLPDRGAVALFTSEQGRVHVRRLDPRTMSVSQDVMTLPIEVGGRGQDQPTMLSASADVLVYATASIPRGQRLQVYRRTGELVRQAAQTELDNWPRVSPDRARIAYQRVDWLRGNPDIWVEDLERNTRTRITMAEYPDILPVWAQDGTQIAFVASVPPGRAGHHMLTIAAADGTGIVRAFPCPTADYCEPSDWSRDGRRLLVTTIEEHDTDVWLVDLEVEKPVVTPLLRNDFPERDARFSPDGGWIVYVSDDSGRSEISVRRISGQPRRQVVSAEGGDQPVWRRDGRELFYVDPEGRLRSMPVSWAGDEPTFGHEERLPIPPVGFGHWNTQYDVTADGETIFMLRENDDPAPRSIGVMIGWSRLLETP